MKCLIFIVNGFQLHQDRKPRDYLTQYKNLIFLTYVSLKSEPNHPEGKVSYYNEQLSPQIPMVINVYLAGGAVRLIF